MGLVLDSSVFIAGERRGHSVRRILDSVQQDYGLTETAISAVTIAELTHGIAQILGRIEGEQAAAGISIAFPDLAIGATALFLGLPVLTHNTKHFRLIPNLVLLTL
jgi:predicted nucleic acid-binding protein